jgi:TonB family protein
MAPAEAPAEVVGQETTRTPAGAAGSVLDDLTWITHGPPRVLAPSPPLPKEAPAIVPEPKPRRRILIAAAAGLIVVAVGLAVWLLGPGTRPPAGEVRPAAHREASATPSVAVVREAREAREGADTPGPVPAMPEPTASPIASPSPPASSPPVDRKRRVTNVVPPGVGDGDWLLPGPDVEPPVPLEIASYEYPAAARGTGRKVTVRLSVLVGADGKAADVRVRDGDGSAFGFDEAALDAARRTVFQPATRDGVPGRMWTELLLTFEE